jgi:hypothetical protein
VTKTRQYGVLVTDPTGKVLALRTEDVSGASLLAMPSGKLLRTFEQFPDGLSPRAERWIAKSPVGPGGDYEALTLVDARGDRPLAVLGVDSKIGSAPIAFSHDRMHFAWGSTDGSVYVCDLPEVQRRLASIHMGW